MRQGSSLPSQPLGIKHLEVVWETLGHVYGDPFVRNFGASCHDPKHPGEAGGAGKTWAKGLAGFTPEMLAHGLRACLNSVDTYCVNLTQFKARCLGIPSFAQVALELAEPNRPKSRFSRLVWRNLPGGEHRYKNAHPEKADRYLHQAYDTSVAHVMAGGALPEPIGGEIQQEKRAKVLNKDSEAAAVEMAKVAEFFGDLEPAGARTVRPKSDEEQLLEEIARMTDEVQILTLMGKADRRWDSLDEANGVVVNVTLHFHLPNGPGLRVIKQLVHGVPTLSFPDAATRKFAQQVLFDLMMRDRRGGA